LNEIILSFIPTFSKRLKSGRVDGQEYQFDRRESNFLLQKLMNAGGGNIIGVRVQ